MTTATEVGVRHFGQDELAVLADSMIDRGLEGSPALATVRRLAELLGERGAWLREELTRHEEPLALLNTSFSQENAYRRAKCVVTAREGWLTDEQVMVRITPREAGRARRMKVPPETKGHSAKTVLRRAAENTAPLTLAGVELVGEEPPRLTFSWPGEGKVSLGAAYWGLLFRRHPYGVWYCRPGQGKEVVTLREGGVDVAYLLPPI